jgi:hypothetical protein
VSPGVILRRPQRWHSNDAGEDKLEHIDWEESFDAFEATTWPCSIRSRRAVARTAHSQARQAGPAIALGPCADESIEELRQIADGRDDIWPRPPGLPRALGMPAQPPTSAMS